MGRPSDLFAELSKWRRKAEKRGEACDFNSDIIPDWLAAEVKAAMDTVGPERAFSFLKQRDDERRAIERRLRRKLDAALAGYDERIAAAIAAGEEPDYQQLMDDLRAAIQPEVAAMMSDEALRLSSEVGIVFDPAIINTDAVRWARQYSGELVRGVTGTTRRLVAEATAAFAETPGMTTGDLTRMLEPAFGRTRSEMIAVTEVTRAYSEATNEIQRQVNQTGLQMHRVWHTSMDDKVCLICGPMDGIPEKEWAETLRGAGLKDPSGVAQHGPPAHPRCRCGVGLSVG